MDSIATQALWWTLQGYGGRADQKHLEKRSVERNVFIKFQA